MLTRPSGNAGSAVALAALRPANPLEVTPGERLPLRRDHRLGEAQFSSPPALLSLTGCVVSLASAKPAASIGRSSPNLAAALP